MKWSEAWRRLKPRSALWRTTLVLAIVVLASQFLSMAFFALNLYSPEVQQHAKLSGTVLRLLRQSQQGTLPAAEQRYDERWIEKRFAMTVVRDPRQFPHLMVKPLADVFTNYYARQLSEQLHEPVRVFFVFKPVPVLWLHLPSMRGVWVREPLPYFANYNPFVIIAWGLGVPLLTIVAIVVLVRQLNRPLKRLEQAALRVARGLYGTQLDVEHGPSEIRAVNGAFNRMTRQLVQADKDRSFMLAGISHDLRTPLTRMRLSAEMLAERELAEGLILDIQDMDEILDQFVAYTRDGSEEVAERIDLVALVQEVAAQFAAMIEIRIEAEALPKVWVKRLSIKRLLGNLVNNARRYGQPPIDIHLRQRGTRVELSVHDHGPGIAPAEVPRLLQPFQRGENARSGSSGSGLGLAIVQRIVRMHHGRLLVSNHPEGGLLVRISLPMARYPR